MTFLAALLSSLYEPETRQGRGRCVVHPNKPHDYLENPFMDYAADMTIALAYHKALDDWRDDKKLSGKSQARLLHARYRRIEALYPRQLAAIRQAMGAAQRPGKGELPGHRSPCERLRSHAGGNLRL